MVIRLLCGTCFDTYYYIFFKIAIWRDKLLWFQWGKTRLLWYKALRRLTSEIDRSTVRPLFRLKRIYIHRKYMYASRSIGCEPVTVAIIIIQSHVRSFARNLKSLCWPVDNQWNRTRPQMQESNKILRMYGTYIPNKKFHSIGISVLRDITKIW